jgi:hypothetical protein
MKIWLFTSLLLAIMASDLLVSVMKQCSESDTVEMKAKEADDSCEESSAESDKAQPTPSLRHYLYRVNASSQEYLYKAEHPDPPGLLSGVFTSLPDLPPEAFA